MAYTGALLGSISLADRFRWPIELRAAVIGGLVGAIAWFAPGFVGGGDTITQWRYPEADRTRFTLVFLLRFFLGPVSYAAAPSGLVAPRCRSATRIAARLENCDCLSREFRQAYHP